MMAFAIYGFHFSKVQVGMIKFFFKILPNLKTESGFDPTFTTTKLHHQLYFNFSFALLLLYIVFVVAFIPTSTLFFQRYR